MVYCRVYSFAVNLTDFDSPIKSQTGDGNGTRAFCQAAMRLVQRVNMMSTTPSKLALLEDTQQYEQLTTNIDSIVWEMDVRW
jgi:hypothetical protein